ncbi:unnamed protein product [Thelazia callipaeda]|uniref:Protein lin-10 n=1 Tax=Thelazia callipaeda TaxID=103827 RepID=A0A0N5CLC7_THECL|nr:unnamed protein product [Thelazia callipaeda]
MNKVENQENSHQAHVPSVDLPKITEATICKTTSSSASTEKQESSSNANNTSVSIQDECRTSVLIKKQMNEIDKEINRRIQNRNIKKVCNFNNYFKFSALPFGTAEPNKSNITSPKPTLEQLRNSFALPVVSKDCNTLPYQALSPAYHQEYYSQQQNQQQLFPPSLYLNYHTESSENFVRAQSQNQSSLSLPTTMEQLTQAAAAALVMVHEPAVLIEGVLFRARYLGSTQLLCESRPTKTSRMMQAQEAVARVKAPAGEIQPSTDIDLFISTEKIMVLNTDLQRISDTDVRQDILMDHALRTISYIADIGDLVVLMARRMSQPSKEETFSVGYEAAPRVTCHVFESDEASFIAQSIGQAFQVAYVEFLRANGIDDPSYLREIDYQEVLNSQELLGDELEMFARKETQKDVVVPKKAGEPLGVVVVESGWGSMLPTVIIANLQPNGAASRCSHLNIGDQIIAINGISLVGLPLASLYLHLICILYLFLIYIQSSKFPFCNLTVKLTVVSTPPVVEVRIKRPDTKYQLGFSVQNGVICSLLRGGIAERGGIRVGHRIIEINSQSVVAVPHEKIVNMLASAVGEIHMKTMPTSMFRLLTGQEVPNYI